MLVNIGSEKLLSLLDVSSKFPNIIAENEQQELDCEWRALLISGKVDGFLAGDTNTETFKSKVHASDRYSPLFRFARTLISVPIYNADCERIISLVNLRKVKKGSGCPMYLWQIN